MRATVRLLRADLEGLGVGAAGYESVNYGRTQAIGAAVASLGCDGLIVPSARWSCENLVMLLDNHRLHQVLELEQSDEVEWLAWAKKHGRL